MCKTAIILAVSMAASASAFQLGAPAAAPMALRQSSMCSARHSQFIGTPAARQAPAVRGRSSTELKMSLFGLGVPELAVIGVLAALIFGPKNLAGKFVRIMCISDSANARCRERLSCKCSRPCP